jgi:hypothetical protein
MDLAGRIEEGTIHWMVEERHILPDINRLSVLTATIMLAYALTRYVNIEPANLGLNFLGIFLSFQIDFKTIVSVLVAALAATGSDWLLRDHPALFGKAGGWRSTLQHWILPALTAWVIGVPLGNLSTSPEWWIVFGMGGVLLVLVFIAEYSVADVADIRHPAATVGLTALSFSLYLILAIAVRSASFRLYLMLPALALAVWLVSLRTLYLRLSGKWLFAWASVIAVVAGQIAMALHYWPVSPIRFGLILLGPSYALTSVVGGLEEGRPVRSWLVEPVVMLSLIWGLAFWLE